MSSLHHFPQSKCAARANGATIRVEAYDPATGDRTISTVESFRDANKDTADVLDMLERLLSGESDQESGGGGAQPAFLLRLTTAQPSQARELAYGKACERYAKLAQLGERTVAVLLERGAVMAKRPEEIDVQALLAWDDVKLAARLLGLLPEAKP